MRSKDLGGNITNSVEDTFGFEGILATVGNGQQGVGQGPGRSPVNVQMNIMLKLPWRVYRALQRADSRYFAESRFEARTAR